MNVSHVHKNVLDWILMAGWRDLVVGGNVGQSYVTYN